MHVKIQWNVENAMITIIFQDEYFVLCLGNMLDCDIVISELHMGRSMMYVKVFEETHGRPNSIPKQVLDVSLTTLRSGSLVRSGNYCCSSIRVASIEENKTAMTHTQTTYTNRIALRAGKKGAHPAEVGALASVFEKSATELKRPKLLKCKQTLQIATFNVRTLNRIGQLPELIASAVEHKIDIICIQEHRYTHTEDIKYHETGNGWSLVTVSAWKNSVNATVGGVGLLIGPRALKTLNSIEKIQPRMMAATFNGNLRATIICYSPTNVSEETELVTFYDELSSLVRSIPKHNMLVIGGDMNAQIGKNGNNEYSLHNTSNRNGQHLTDFMIENRLACLNTNYQKREGKLWTYTYANNTKAQIDYVLINKKWKNSAMNGEAYSSFEGVSTDHRIITAKIRLSQRKTPNEQRPPNTMTGPF